MISFQLDGVAAYLRAYRTAESSAVRWLQRFLAPQVAVSADGEAPDGDQAVLERLSRVRPMWSAMTSVGFSAPRAEEDGTVSVSGAFPPLGAAPEMIELRFWFDAAGRIVRVAETVVPRLDAGLTGVTLPAFVRGCVDGALANGTPLTLGYVDGDGRPRLSLRGSVHVTDEMQLGLWLRPGARLAKVLRTAQDVGLMYRDARTRTTLQFCGTARIEGSAEARERVFNMIPEVEQAHDPAQQGSAVLTDLESVEGASPLGRVMVRRA